MFKAIMLVYNEIRAGKTWQKCLNFLVLKKDDLAPNIEPTNIIEYRH
jgi:hypothetical protein